MRTFIAIELESPLRQLLVRVLRDSLPSSREVRWCSEDQLHLTLKFLGEVHDTRLPQVCEVVKTACARVAPFAISLQGWGCFPDQRSPRVLWCGVRDPEEGCRRWVAAADPLLNELGFPIEGRAFTPHITLGRSRSAAGARLLRQVFQTVAPPSSAPMQVREIVVFESRLAPTGAQYRSLATIPLVG